ncbi:alpha/beta hydrolase [Methylobacterium oryzihabitans]|uniref:alpha/beta hydrolase n=1 Tax=Methylobacterium oryzihabitans TaxID=2499852 RepID=UPI001FE88FD1|nr:alpha/beta hydrolase [Methylobacterium oryzihabitans]
MTLDLWHSDEAPLGPLDPAYDNAGAIPGAREYPPRWTARAAAFRSELAAAGRADLDRRYGAGERQVYDLFRPDGAPAGLAVFVHGGYWKAFDQSVWSHLAAGALARGFCVALPRYTLCPQARIADITAEIGAFLDRLAGAVAGPIRLSGHSAGGHLVTRMLCADAPLAPATVDRIDRAVSISGVHDLRPLLGTAMNAVLRLDPDEARRESPALLEPRPGATLVAVAGGDELPEFRRQTALMANVWHGLGATTRAVAVPGRHHFDVIDELENPDSAMVAALAGSG